MAKPIEMTTEQRAAASQLAKLLPQVEKVKSLRATLKPIVDAGVFDKAPYVDEESGLTFSVKISRSLFVESAA